MIVCKRLAGHSPATLTVAQARKLIGEENISRAGFYDAIKRNEIPCIRLGRRLLVIRERFEALLSGSRTPLTPGDPDDIR
jgi:hypothetical protein